MLAVPKWLSNFAVALGIVGVTLFAGAILRATLTDSRGGLIWFGNFGANCVGDVTPQLWIVSRAGPWNGPTAGATAATRFNVAVIDYNRVV